MRLAAVLLLVSCGSGEPPSSDDAGSHDAAQDAFAEAGLDGGPSCTTDAARRFLEAALTSAAAPGGAAQVLVVGDCEWQAAVGLTDVESGRPALADDLFRIGEVSESFTAAVALSLVQEGAITLDEPLARWVDGFDGAGEITLRHLLGHTSGLYDPTSDPAQPLNEPSSPEQIASLAAEQSPVFEPGSAWAPSRTDDVLVGLMIEAATGSTLGHEVRRRVLEPLDLEHTFMDVSQAEGALALPYEPDGSGGFVEVNAAVHPSWLWASAAMVSCAGDLARWARALFSGELFGDELLSEMLSPVVLSGGERTDSGLGVTVRRTELGLSWGHMARGEGLSAFFALWPEHGVVGAAVFNGPVDVGPSLAQML